MNASRLGLLLAVALLFGAPGCFIPDELDGDFAPDDGLQDEPVVDDDDAGPVEPPAPAPFWVSGEIVAVDRETGVVLSEAEFAQRASGIIVYALEDPDDLSEILGKDTLAVPGEYAIEVEHERLFWVVAVADWNHNRFIDDGDVLRHHPDNPLAARGGDLEDVDVWIDLPVPVPDEPCGDCEGC